MKTSRTITCGIMTCMWILALFAASVSAGSLERQRRQLGPDCQLMNWQAHGGNEYGYFDHIKSFTAAEGICMRCQATIASISSAEEMTFVRALVPGGHAFWLGASDRGTEGTFVWLDGSSMSYTNWRKDEPDNQSTDEDNEADCAYVNSHGLWRDNHCDLNSKRFVCKRAATGPIVTTVSPPPTTAPTTMMTRPMLTQTMGTSPMMMTTQTMPPVTTVAPVSIADAAPSVDPRVQSMPVFITGPPQQEVSQIRYEEVSRSSPRPTTLQRFTMTDATTPPPPPPPTTTATRRVVTTARRPATTARATTTVRPTTTTARATTTARRPATTARAITTVRPTTTTARATTAARRPATTSQPRTTETTTRRSVWSYVRGAADKAKSKFSRWFGKRR